MPEPLNTLVGYNNQIEFANGIARQHSIPEGASLRVQMDAATTSTGRAIPTPDDPFIVDLKYNSATRFVFPDDFVSRYDIEEGMRVDMQLLEVITDGSAIPLGESGNYPRELGEPVSSRVRSDRRVQFADGLAALYNIEPKDSLRVTLNAIYDRWGDVRHEDLSESFVVDTRYNSATKFDLPQYHVKKYDIGSEEFVQLELQQLITPDDSRPIGTRRPPETVQLSRDDQRRTPSLNFNYEAREQLEQVVAQAFDSLGYEVKTNDRRDATEDGDREVDVWANHPTATLAVYVSCKNHCERIGLTVLDEEVGRVAALRQRPQLIVIVGPEFTDQARQELNARGLVGIETGQKAIEENREEIYRDVREQLAGSMVSLVSPRLQELSQRAASLSEEISRLASDHQQRR